MRFSRISLTLIAGALLASAAAHAADNAIIITPGSGVTLRSKDVGSGVQSPIDILGDISGNAIYGTAGTANANVLSIQGESGMTPVGVSAAASAFADGWNLTEGTKADAKSSATDTTAITAMQVWKEISYLLQNALSVTGSNVGGYDTGSAPFVSVTPGASSKTSGEAIGCATGTCTGNQGAVFAIPVARTNGGSGLITQFQWTSVGGSVVGIMVKLWDANPTNTTCKDQTAYSGSTTDDAHLLTPPFALTPAAPAVTTGDAKTYASYSFTPPLSFKNQDGTASKNIYACVISTGSDTADESSAVSAQLSAVQD